MGIRGLLKDAARAAGALLAGSPRSMEGQMLTATRGGSATAVQVPDEVQTSMQQQGMSMGGQFSPGEPMPPYQPIGSAPVITPFLVGQNLFAVPRGTTGVGFDTLRTLAGQWDMARMCIEVREDELRGLDWEISADDEDDAERYKSEIAAARKFFEHPDGIGDFDTFQARVAEDWLRYDAATIFRHRTRAGKLAALEPIDGTTIMPLIDGRGAMPRDPSPAYVQWAWGLPYTWLSERDVIYQPNRPRTETRYGLPPLEWLLIRANTDLRQQWYFLSFFTRGEVPEVFVNAPPDVQDPKQVRALQDAYSAVMSGASAPHHMVKWIPAGAKVFHAGKGRWDISLAQYMDGKAAAAFKVQPNELGFVQDVNRSTGEVQENVQFRRSVKPSVNYFQAMWKRILHEDLGMPYARFKYLGIEAEEDQLVLAQTRAIYIQNAVISPDEVRKDIGYETDPDAPVGRSFAMRTGVIFVDPKSQRRAREAGSLAQQYGMEPGTVPPPQPPPDEDETADDPSLLSPSQATADPVVKPQPAKAGAGAVADPAAAAKAAQADLRKWRDVAVKRAKAGRPQRPFESAAIDPVVKGLLWKSLAKAATADEVREAFGPAIGGASPLAKATREPGEPRRPVIGSPVNMDRAKRRASQTAIQENVAKLLKRQGKAAASHVRRGLDDAGDELAATADDGAPDLVERILASFGWRGWDEELKSGVEPHLVDLFGQAATEGAAAVGASLAWGLVEPRAKDFAEARAAELVGKKRLEDGTLVDNPNGKYVISDATRQMVHDHVVSAIKAGDSPYEIEKSIQQHYAFSDARAETIARTEGAFAYNHGAVAGYRQAGVSQVEVMDGDDDPECAAADGAIWTLDEAEGNPTAHPNCTRAFAPLPAVSASATEE